MTTIKKKDLFNVKTLLEQRQAAMDAIDMLGKSQYRVAIFVVHEDDNDSMEVDLNYGVAKATLIQQLKKIDADLAKLDLVVAEH